MSKTKWLGWLLLLPLSLFAWKMESGTVTLPATSLGSSTWQTVTFAQTYDTAPLVFALIDEGSGYSGDTPVIIRIRNVTTTSVEMAQVEGQSIVESSSNQGPHPSVNVHYIVIEPGDHTLSDGTRIVAETLSTTTKQGRFTSGSQGFDTVTFSPAFAATPVVLGMVQGVANETNTLPGLASSPWLTQTIRNVGTGSFQIAIERAETSVGSITANETIAYLAVDAGKQGELVGTSSCDQIQYETLRTSDSIRGWQNGCYTFNFSNTYASIPHVIGAQNTRDGGDGGWLRRCSLTSTHVGLTIDEDQAHDSERGHTTEVAGLIVFEKGFVYDSAKTLQCKNPVAEYRMDECYWLGSGTFDVMDSKGGDNAEAYNNAQPDRTDAIVNFSGGFGATGYFQPETTIAIGNDWSYALWIKFPLDSTNHDSFSISGTNSSNAYFYHCLGSISNAGDLPAILKESGGNDLMWELYDANQNDTVADLPNTLNGWHHFVFVQSGSSIKLYLDSTYYNEVGATITGDAEGYLTSFDDRDKQTVGSKVDEVKLWSSALSAEEVKTLYDNESAGNNYDGSARSAVTCSASIAANSWELVGIPADLRTDAKTVADIFSDDMNGTYGTDWRIYRRDYSSTDNSSSYTYLNETDLLDFGKGYWLGSKNASTWSANGAAGVDYDYTGSDCPAAQCVEIDLKSVTHDFNVDPDDGTGPYRYNMSGFIGQSPVDWADCRFVIDGTAYTPSDANASGYASKQIWQYNPGNGGANSNGYTTCDDTTPGGCKLEPYKGFWVELHGPTKGKTVKLLIPKE